MKSIYLAIIFLLLFGVASGQGLSVKDLSVEHKTNPIGIENSKPRFSWKINSMDNNVMQTAYLMRVAKTEKFSSADIIWQSGKVKSDESILQIYQGPDLKSGQRYFWQVKIWDNKGKESRWSNSGFLGDGTTLHYRMESKMD